MNLMQLPKGEIVLVDANIFVYAAQCCSLQCLHFLERCANRELNAIMPTNILAEVMHVLMLGEARELGFVTGSHPAKQLSEHPETVKSMARYDAKIKDLLSIGIHLEPIQREDFFTAISYQHQYGLLTNDALFIAVATRLRISAVISADKMFSKIKGITLYKPDDIKIQ